MLTTTNSRSGIIEESTWSNNRRRRPMGPAAAPHPHPVHRHNHQHPTQVADSARRKLHHRTMPKQIGYLCCMRVSLISVLGILSTSLLTTMLWLPYIAHDAGVQRNTLGILPHHGGVSSRKTIYEENHSTAMLMELKEVVDENEWHPPNKNSSSGTEVRIVPRNEDSSTNNGTTPKPYGSYQSLEERDGRRSRFPGVVERTKTYMSNWYLPPCDTKHDDVIEYKYEKHNATTNVMMFKEARTLKEKIRGPLRLFAVDDSVTFDVLHYLNVDTVKACHNSYCADFAKYLLPSLQRMIGAAKTNETTPAVQVPVLYQFSDAEKTRGYSPSKGKFGGNPNVPSFKKFRLALSKTERERVVTGDCAASPRPLPVTVLQQQQLEENAMAKLEPAVQPLIFKLKMQRHYGFVKDVPAQDVPWGKKQNKAIFRGQFTGRFPATMLKKEILERPVHDQCQLLHRCRLVYNSDASQIVDAKLALPVLELRKDFPKNINGIDLYGERISVADMLQYKAIIMLEGNDVSSGLKWALYSNSVVMAQTPTKTSWAMEEMLEPWVHYIPLADDLSDVESKMHWVIDNDEKAQAIAHAGQLWISDLVFHPDSAKDEELIFDEMLRRSLAHFRHNPALKLAAASTVKQKH